MKYRKNQLEDLVLVQLENLNAQGVHIQLIKEQNELLLKQNHKLTEALSEKNKGPKPYPVPKRNKP